MAKSMKLGGGGRFEKLKSSIAKRGNVRDPGAVAAAIGRKKYGTKKFAALSRHGKRAHNREEDGVFHGNEYRDGYRRILVPRLWEHEREEA